VKPVILPSASRVKVMKAQNLRSRCRVAETARSGDSQNTQNREGKETEEMPGPTHQRRLYQENSLESFEECVVHQDLSDVGKKGLLHVFLLLARKCRAAVLEKEHLAALFEIQIQQSGDAISS